MSEGDGARRPPEELLRLDRLGPVLAEATADPAWADLTATLIAGGKSNLTFDLVNGAQRHLVLRRPPTGELLPTAHDMGREARVQRALAPTEVPVARIVLEDGGDLNGAPFYVMNKVEGHIVRDRLPAGYADTPARRRAVADGLVDTLVALHAVDPDAVGLTDFGRPDGFLARQVRRWRKQWDASRDVEMPEVEQLADRLAADVPVSGPPAVVHGDFRIDNCVLDADVPGRVAAVLDWEMSTLGDPLTDLGLLLFYWREPGDPDTGIVPAVTDQPGFPTRGQLVERYAAGSGRDVGSLAFYEAFAHFKFAVIMQGIQARVTAGSMGGQDFGDLHDSIAHIARTGLELSRRP